MSVKVGDRAPDFILKSKNIDGEVHDIGLSDYSGKNVLLLFFPAAFSGGCTKEICSVIDGLDQYSSLDAEVIGVSVDSVFAQEGWSKVNNISVPLLSDFNKKIISEYGVAYPDGGFVYGMNGVAKRSAFVIDKEGVIRYAEIKENAGELPDFEKIKEVLKGLN